MWRAQGSSPAIAASTNTQPIFWKVNHVQCQKPVHLEPARVIIRLIISPLRRLARTEVDAGGCCLLVREYYERRPTLTIPIKSASTPARVDTEVADPRYVHRSSDPPSRKRSASIGVAEYDGLLHGKDTHGVSELAERTASEVRPQMLN